ncbi:MAG: magnesium/cobalt transporter CorA [Planctomycetota bacterium]
MAARRSTSKVGLPPGTLVHVGEKKTATVIITVMDYDETACREIEVGSVEECLKYKDAATVTWINVDGIHRVDLIEDFEKHFGLHPLLLEDVVNTNQRPKVEDYEDHLFIVVKMLYFREDGTQIYSEQVSLVLGKGYVISFQEVPGDVFEMIRERIRTGKGRIRKMGPDYLAYSLIDAIVDNYFAILETFGERIEAIQEELIERAGTETLQAIHEVKRDMVVLRKSIWPMRDVVSGLERSESGLVDPRTHVYLRDAYDHTLRVVDTVETYRDMLAGMIDVYLSSLSNRMNEIMKVLTIIATIFIPLTFIAGIYGMNFNYMPELKWRAGYFIVLGVMAALGLGMIYAFRRKKWL